MPFQNKFSVTAEAENINFLQTQGCQPLMKHTEAKDLIRNNSIVQQEKEMKNDFQND